MEQVFNLYKPQGVTPFQLVQQLKKENPEYSDLKIGFAGRLDPLAHGVMVLLVGEENKNREQYLGLEKEYEFDVLFGVKTDSYDYLGLLDGDFNEVPTNFELRINEFIKKYVGDLILPYPPFSSKTLNGVPLYKLAKKHKLSQGDLPVRGVEIKQFKLLKIETKTSEQIHKEMLTHLRKVRGFFRQTKIIARWKEFFKKNPNQEFVLARFKIQCSSGTYVRTLVQLMGETVGCGAIAFEILRIRIGNFVLKDSQRLSGK